MMKHPLMAALCLVLLGSMAQADMMSQILPRWPDPVVQVPVPQPEPEVGE